MTRSTSQLCDFTGSLQGAEFLAGGQGWDEDGLRTLAKPQSSHGEAEGPAALLGPTQNPFPARVGLTGGDEENKFSGCGFGTDICNSLWLLGPQPLLEGQAILKAKNTFCPLILAPRWPLHSDVCLLAVIPASGLQTGKPQYALPGATPETIWTFSCRTIQGPACRTASTRWSRRYLCGAV
ncbi:hypothetical protein CB1_001616044 [Camelus ferus]|nr:hypothetical protein CB1_001616044 [Camelus ferus]